MTTRQQAVGAPRSTSGPLHLTGWQLTAGRLVWLAVTVATVAVFLSAMPVTYHAFQVVCNDPNQCQITPELARSLHAAHLTPEFYASYLIAINGVTALIYIALAMFLFWRRSDDRIALLAAITFVTFGGMSFTSDVTRPLAMTGVGWYWVVAGLDLIGQICFFLLFCTFPDGRFVPRWTVGIVIAGGLYWFIDLFAPTTFPALNSDSAWGGMLFISLVISTIVAQIYRYRRVSTPQQRQQTKWVVSGYALGVGCFIALVLMPKLLPPSMGTASAVGQLVGTSAVYLCILVIPLSIVVAVSRSRLWDIDIIINRALVYGSLTAILAGLYFGLVIGAQSLLQAFNSTQSANSPVVIVVSTLLIAALFQPLRRRIQRTIDRRFYRTKYDAAKTLERFAASLRQEVELDQLTEQLLFTVAETVQPTHVSVWMASVPVGRRQGSQNATAADVMSREIK